MPSTSTNKNKNKVVSEEESETSVDESDVSGSEGEYVSWVSWFCNLKGHEFFCEVDDDYIQDDFNLCGLSSQVPYYDYALDLILDVESSHGDKLNEEQNSLVESAAEMLYGLIHARYILTSKGMSAMMEKYKNNEFGTCPRTFCSEQSCLPVGQSDIPRSSYVRIYCPQCEDIYLPRTRYQYGDTYVCHVYYFYWKCFICKLVHLKEASYKSAIDGAYFGSTFPHLFLMTYSHLKPQRDSRTYVPKVFGFKVHKP